MALINTTKEINKLHKLKIIDDNEINTLKNIKITNISKIPKDLIQKIGNSFDLICPALLKGDTDILTDHVLSHELNGLSDDQKNAIREIITFLYNANTMFCLFGYAGTGKTTTIIELLYVLLTQNTISSIVLTAPTNKATDIIKAKIKKYIDILCDKDLSFDDKLVWIKKYKQMRIEITTIHKLLNYNNDFNTNGDKIFVKKGKSLIDKYDIVIIDECSMLPVGIMCDIFDEVRKKKHDTKVIFIGDFAQLPPISEKFSLIFSQNIKQIYEAMLPQLKEKDDPIFVVTNKTLTTKIDLFYSDITNMKKYTLTTIVRSNNQNIINLSNNIRKWVLGEIQNPDLNKYKGDGVYIYNSTSKKSVKKWFDTFISYCKKNSNNIILAWRNITCYDYNNNFRKTMFNIDITNKFTKGDILLVNDFYNFDEIKIGDSKSVKYYTSEQIKVLQVEELTHDVGTINEKKHNIKDQVILSHLTKTINNINNYISQSYKVYKLCVTKLGDNMSNESSYIFVLHDDSICKNEQDRNISSDEIKKLRMFFEQKYNNKLKTLDKEIIKYLWKEREKILISPFCCVTYGASISCHKSQSSTYHNVFVDANDILLNKNYDECKRCIYTAISRASNELHLLI